DAPQALHLAGSQELHHDALLFGLEGHEAMYRVAENHGRSSYHGGRRGLPSYGPRGTERQNGTPRGPGSESWAAGPSTGGVPPDGKMASCRGLRCPMEDHAVEKAVLRPRAARFVQ